MTSLRLLTAAATLAAGTLLATTPGWAETAYQSWSKGHGVWVSSTAHPPELYEFFEGVAAGDGLPVAPPPYYDPYARAVPPAYDGYDGAPAF